VAYEEKFIKPLFIQTPSVTLRAIFFFGISVTCMVTDYRYDYIKQIRTELSVVMYPLQYIVNLPVQAGLWLSQNFSTRGQLLDEMAQLRERNLRLQVSLQKYEDLKSENERLRALLDSSIKLGERMMLAEVFAVDLDPFSRKIMINKGKTDNVFNGQPLLDAYGVLGQVTNTSQQSSTVMLITDPNHALPVQVVRTGLRTIAMGMGATNRLKLLYLPNNSGIKVGDLLVTSGLGGQFPPGYPVGTVVEFTPDIGQPYAQVQAIPSAHLERNREVLLVWTSEENQKAAAEVEQKP
jgi:rod shape-determining protein MreC